jgi:hypothetical protein
MGPNLLDPVAECPVAVRMVAVASWEEAGRLVRHEGRPGREDPLVAAVGLKPQMQRFGDRLDLHQRQLEDPRHVHVDRPLGKLVGQGYSTCLRLRL